MRKTISLVKIVVSKGGRAMRKLPTSCPSCGSLLKVKRFECPACDTVVDGDFALPVLGRLRLSMVGMTRAQLRLEVVVSRAAEAALGGALV